MRAGARTVQLHEGIEGSILGIIALFMLIGLTKRPGLEVSSVPELEIIADLRSPLIKESKSGSARYTKRGHGTRTLGLRAVTVQYGVYGRTCTGPVPYRRWPKCKLQRPYTIRVYGRIEPYKYGRRRPYYGRKR